jgi:hypothetical protein
MKRRNVFLRSVWTILSTEISKLFTQKIFENHLISAYRDESNLETLFDNGRFSSCYSRHNSICEGNLFLNRTILI